MSRVHRPSPQRALRSLARRLARVEAELRAARETLARMEAELHAARETLSRVPPPPYQPLAGEIVHVRGATGCSLREARSAIVEARGDFARACEIVNRRGLA